MKKTCETCPNNCVDCVFNEGALTTKPFCFACADGYKLSDNDECLKELEP